jgi:beta-glucosidase
MKQFFSIVLSFFVVVFLACSPKEQTSVSATNISGESAIDSLIGLMTLEEKVGMIHASSSFTSGGVKRLGIPEWTMSDGPHGVRKEHGRDWEADTNAADSATYLPVGVTLAATWNPELGYAFGKVLGSEAAYRGKDVILGPGVNIIRTPLNGRNFEYLGEDPYLVSRMAVGYIKGVQEQGVSACVKHFVANNQETDRNAVNVEMSERALREIYLPAFKAAVTEGNVNTLMGAYNKFRGQYCTHNEYLINTIVKGEWQFQGAVISDWGAVMNTMEAVKNGTDVEMGTDLSMLPKPDYNKFYMADAVIKGVKDGTIDEKLIDDKVRRILRVMQKTNMFGKRKQGAFNTPEHQKTALQVAEEGIVLLKNENILPLDRSAIKSIAVIGANATRKHAGAGGSSQVNAKYEITPLEGIQQLAGKDVKVTHVAGYEIRKDGKADQKLIAEAVRAASTSDVVIYVGGWFHGYSDAWNDNAYDAEGIDKPSMILPFGQDELLQVVLKANPRAVVVMMGGGPMDMNKWIAQARSVVFTGYPGMEGGRALANILFGEVTPSGKLTMTFPKKLEDSPAHKIGEYPGTNKTVNYKEDIFVGYRYFDTHKVAPQFAFGHGLSYTVFDYSNLSVTAEGKTVKVKLSITNSGKRVGAEVVQIYVHDEEASVKRPQKELKAFQKVLLNPGETKALEFSLNEDAFQYYDETKKQWVLENGKFIIMAGSSSQDIRLQKDITL